MCAFFLHATHEGQTAPVPVPLQVLKILPNASRIRQEACVIFYGRSVRRAKKFHLVLRTLLPDELYQVARRIGWLNLIAWHDPDQLRYRFHLGLQDEYDAAARLARNAVARASSSKRRVWHHVVVDGKQLALNEDDNFWCDFSFANDT